MDVRSEYLLTFSRKSFSTCSRRKNILFRANEQMHVVMDDLRQEKGGDDSPRLMRRGRATTDTTVSSHGGSSVHRRTGLSLNNNVGLVWHERSTRAYFSP